MSLCHGFSLGDTLWARQDAEGRAARHFATLKNKRPPLYRAPIVGHRYTVMEDEHPKYKDAVRVRDEDDRGTLAWIKCS